jgi:hypothetical protein
MGGETQKTINFGGKLNFILSFLFLEHLHYCYYVFTSPICTTIIIILEPCALNVKFQHFVLSYNIWFIMLICINLALNSILTKLLVDFPNKSMVFYFAHTHVHTHTHISYILIQ